MTLPIDRTALTAATTNQVPNSLIRSALNIAALTTPYNTIDELYNYTSSLVTTGNLLYLRTAADVTYYVRTDGNDANTGLANTAGAAFLTITKAISMIPQIVNHAITINVADGTYNETVTLEGKVGSGTFAITGNATTPTNCKVNNFVIRRCPIGLTLNGFEATTTTELGISVNRCLGVNISNFRCVGVAATFSGILVQHSTVYTSTCTLSNRQRGIDAQACSVVYSETNGGAGNTIGLYANHASKIGKSGTQPAGTAAESSNGGSQIS